MLVLGIDIALAVIGLMVLGVLVWRLWRQVRQLGSEVSDAGQRIATASEELARIAPTGQ